MFSLFASPVFCVGVLTAMGGCLLPVMVAVVLVAITKGTAFVTAWSTAACAMAVVLVANRLALRYLDAAFAMRAELESNEQG
jgi:hypothetical protein